MDVLRPLVPTDLDALLEVQREGAVAGLGHIFDQGVHPFPTERVRQRWERELADPDVDCFAIIAGGRLAGFVATRGDEVLHFGTAVATWGTGLATRAHDEALDHLRAQGVRTAWLRVLDENQRAIRFYRRRGWRPTQVTAQIKYPPHPTVRRFERELWRTSRGWRAPGLRGPLAPRDEGGSLRLSGLPAEHPLSPPD